MCILPSQNENPLSSLECLDYVLRCLGVLLEYILSFLLYGDSLLTAQAIEVPGVMLKDIDIKMD